MSDVETVFPLNEEQDVQDSSIDAFRDEGDLGETERRQRLVFKGVKAVSDDWVSGRELWRFLVTNNWVSPPSDVYSSFQPRLNELEERGLLVRSDDRFECGATGKSVYKYRVKNDE